MSCKGICIRHKAKIDGFSKNRYLEDQKRCQTCSIFIIWDVSLFCPCCNMRLRIKPRNGKAKVVYKKGSKTGCTQK
jgi:hypothetical protein